MSITTKQKKAFTALATATAALGLLTGPALAQATPTASTGCTQWQFMGNFAFNQSNGYSVSFPATGTTVGETPDANGRIPGGDPPRTATAMPGGNTGVVSGRIYNDGTPNVKSGIQFRIFWPGGNLGAGTVGSYSGSVDDNGFAHGHTTDISNNLYASWDSTVPLGCVTPAAPATRPTPPPAPPLPGTDPKPNHPVPVTAPPTPLPGTDPKPNPPVPVTTPPTPPPGIDRKPNFPVP